jgi:TatD DNase family protein
MMSIHSTGAATEVVALLREHEVRGPILHWFGGSADEIHKAADNGAWFSVNGAMKDESIAAMPADRVVTETDFPHTRRAGSRRPGATDPVERRLARIWRCNPMQARQLLWQNFHTLVSASGVRSRLPKSIQSLLLGHRSRPVAADGLLRLRHPL